MAATAGLIVASVGLMQHKLQSGKDRLQYSRVEYIPVEGVESGPLFSWLDPTVLHKLQEAQTRCSGVDLFLMLVNDITSTGGTLDTEDFIARLRMRVSEASQTAPLVSRVDWDFYESQVRNEKMSIETAARLARQSLISVFMEHGEFISLFTPHLTRVPRNADGKLIPNKDAGCAPADFIFNSAMVQQLSQDQRHSAVRNLEAQGIVTLANIVPLNLVERVRNDLRIKSSYSPNQKRFDTRETNPEEIFAGDRAEDVDFKLLASGRYWYQLRCSPLESLVKPIHASVMPVVWEYLARQRTDSYLNRLVGQESKTGKHPRVFLSEVALVCADPLSGSDSWHATNGSGGVVVMVPLSPFEESNGNMVYLPGSHKAWRGPGGILRTADTVLKAGGVNECTATCGDAVVLDARLMRMTLKNELFNRSKVWVAFHYDFNDRPAPGQWLPRTLFMNALSVVLVHMDNLYRKLPPISPPNKLE